MLSPDVLEALSAVSDAVMTLSVAIVAKSIIGAKFGSKVESSTHVSDAKETLELVRQCCKNISITKDKQIRTLSMQQTIIKKQDAIDGSIEVAIRQLRDNSNSISNSSEHINNIERSANDIKAELAVVKDRVAKNV